MIEVLWFVDRFGIRGDYHAIWLRLLTTAGIKATTVKQVHLHNMLGGQLLTRFGSRSAPTWRPEREGEILAKMEQQIKAAGPGLKAIVLAAPEALCSVGLAPEFATLNKLRGSVYAVFGVKAIVMLPISVYHTQVSTRDIQMANYGASNAETLARSVSALEVKSATDSTENEDEAEPTESEDDEEEDTFFYVPVMTSVGKFFLQCDTGKLSRIVNGRTGQDFNPI